MRDNRFEYIRCNLCQQDNTKLKYRIKSSKYYPQLFNALSYAGNKPPLHWQIVQCRNCGLIYVNPRLKLTELINLYPREMFIDRWGRKDVIRSENTAGGVKTRRKCIERYKREGCILDVGCANGFFLLEMKRHNWQAYGVEFSETASECARTEYKLNVFTGTLEEAKFSDNFFDVVTMYDLIEHLSYPMESLRESNRILRNGGLIVIVTGDIDSFYARIAQRHWEMIGPSSHLYYFSQRTLRAMLKKAGFRILEVSICNKSVKLFYRQVVGGLKFNLEKLLIAKMYRLKPSERMKLWMKKQFPPQFPCFWDQQLIVAQKINRAPQ